MVKEQKVIVKESMHGLGASLLKKTIVDGILPETCRN
jgi:hypothetical protein